MSDNKMIALPSDAAPYRKLLFELDKPVVLSQEEYDAYWPLVDAVWTKIGGTTVQQNGTVKVQHYECRLRKSKKTGTNQVQKEGRVVKNRITSTRVKDLCQVKMKITRTLEAPVLIRIERKDDNTHTHDIEECFRLCGLPTAVKRVVQAEATKDYTAAQIFQALKGAGKVDGSADLEIAGGSSLKRQDILNAKRGIRADSRPLLHSVSFRADVDEARTLLSSKGWLFAEFDVLDAKKEQRWGLVFADPKRLQNLQCRGYLTQFDSTHKMNKWKHNMFSFLVRDENGMFIPAAHCVVDRENSETLGRAMEFLKSWCHWQPRYVLTDDSSIEQLAVKKTFHGLQDGEQEVSHLLCTVHTMRTLQRKFSSAAAKPVFDLLRHAMFTFTGVKCLELCEQALRIAPDDLKAYVRTHWLDTRAKWAMFARQHSPLLLQVTTTNPCEAWHRKLKAAAGATKGKVATFGIYGMILHIMNQAKDVDYRVATASSNASNKVLSICMGDHPAIARFPVVIQKLLAPEVLAVEERTAEGKDIPEFDEDLICHCSFARRYLLPCRHIFHLNTVTPILTAEKWDYYVSMFAGCGMEVYETMGTVHVAEEVMAGDGGKVQSLLELREIEERLHHQLHAVHEILDERHAPEENRQAVVTAWVDHVRVTVASILDIHPEEIVDRNRPWEL